MTASQTYSRTLATARTTGTARQTDPQLMAMFCDTAIQILCGAVSPRLVWEGAQAQGLAARDLVRLAHDDPRAVEGLMWI
jgi:hypothetical protein